MIPALLVSMMTVFIFALRAFFRGVLGSAFGALAGWFLSVTPLGAWALTAAVGMGYAGDLVELGALLGFAGAFFAGTSAAKSSN